MSELIVEHFDVSDDDSSVADGDEVEDVNIDFNVDNDNEEDDDEDGRT